MWQKIERKAIKEKINLKKQKLQIIIIMIIIIIKESIQAKREREP